MQNLFRNVFRLLGGLLLVVFAPNPSQASPYQSNQGLDQPTQLLTFDEVVLSPRTTMTNHYAAFGVVFSGANPAYDPYDPPGNDGPNVSGHAFSNFKPFDTSGQLVIDFSSNLEAAALSLYSQTGTTTITAYLNGGFVESHNFSTNLTSTTNYYGFVHSRFNQLRITVASFDNAFIADNLQFRGSVVPAPGALVTALLGTVPGATLLLRRRRK